MIAVAKAEFTLLWRNRVLAVCSIIVPLAFAGLLIVAREQIGGLGGGVAALQIVVMAGFGVYITATTTLAARRQTLFLKRLRSTALSDSQILAGLLLPVLLLSLAQIAVVMAVFIAIGRPPAQLPVIVLHTLAIEIMFLGLALATWGITTTPEQAQVTTMPAFIAALGGGIWILMTRSGGPATWIQQALPGGASIEAIIGAWSGNMPTGTSLLLTLPTLAWALLGLSIGTGLFRWEPR